MSGDVPQAVRARYGPPAVDWVPLGAAGGFSGAAVWQGRAGGAPVFCLKAWPAEVAAGRLAEVHRLMIAAGGLPFVPAVVPDAAGNTVVEHAGRVWDVTRWMPGTADFRTAPSAAKLADACGKLALLHRTWAPAAPTLAPCPAVGRRLAVVRRFRGWRSASPFDTSHLPAVLAEAVRRAEGAVPGLLAAAEADLRPWQGRPVPVQPCLCDVHHDHILFTGEVVTGLIDFGAAKTDHPAVDLARLLGDLGGEWFAPGLNAYRRAGPPAGPVEELVPVLAWTGAACGAANWLLRLVAERRAYPDPAALAGRIDRLLRLAGTNAVSAGPFLN